MLARKHKVKHNLASEQMPAGKGYQCASQFSFAVSYAFRPFGAPRLQGRGGQQVRASWFSAPLCLLASIMLARKHKVKHNLASKQMPAGKGYNRGDGKTTKEAYDRGGICGAGRQSPRQTA